MQGERIREAARGLTTAEVLRAREAHGDNRLSEGKRRGFLAHFFSNLGDPVIRILLGALAVNLFFVNSVKLKSGTENRHIFKGCGSVICGKSFTKKNLSLIGTTCNNICISYVYS